MLHRNVAFFFQETQLFRRSQRDQNHHCPQYTRSLHPSGGFCHNISHNRKWTGEFGEEDGCGVAVAWQWTGHGGGGSLFARPRCGNATPARSGRGSVNIDSGLLPGWCGVDCGAYRALECHGSGLVFRRGRQCVGEDLYQCREWDVFAGYAAAVAAVVGVDSAVGWGEQTLNIVFAAIFVVTRKGSIIHKG